MTAHALHDPAIRALCLVAIAGILARPFGIAEWIWASGCAAAVALTGLLPPAAVAAAAGRGTDVYCFLAGMMLLAELARREGVFDWVAGRALAACGGSRRRLFALVYGVGVGVTTVLSNDATAVVLTPAVAAAARAANVPPLPYLFACALVANAASFVLPISNPANLVVFSSGLPALPRWLATFGLPSVCAVAITYGVLLLVFRRELAGAVAGPAGGAPLGTPGRIALAGVGVTAAVLVAASARGASLGGVTLACGAAVYALVAVADRGAALPVLRGIAWSVLPLVAGLFVLVAAAETTGLLEVTRAATSAAAALPAPLALAAAALGAGVGSNLVNNLPAGLIAGTTVASAHVSDAFRGAVAIGIDLGPNLSVTGSLATILWLLALRREKIEIDAWRFLRIGALAMPPALLAAVESLLLARR